MFHPKHETIVHNVGDEPITITQVDGSELTVPPRTALTADLPSEMDIPPANSAMTIAAILAVVLCFAVAQTIRLVWGA